MLPAFLFCAFGKITEALMYVHGVERIIHRNVNPASILLTQSGRWKLACFGFAEKTQDGRVKKITTNLHYFIHVCLIAYMVKLIEHYSNYQLSCYDEGFFWGGGQRAICLTILQLMIAFIYQLSVGIFLM